MNTKGFGSGLSHGVFGVLLTVDKVALLLPDEKSVAQSREDEAGQDLAGTGMGTEEAEAVCQQKYPEAKDGQTFDEGAEPRRA